MVGLHHGARTARARLVPHLSLSARGIVVLPCRGDRVGVGKAILKASSAVRGVPRWACAVWQLLSWHPRRARARHGASAKRAAAVRACRLAARWLLYSKL